jgi:hypothetical protein
LFLIRMPQQPQPLMRRDQAFHVAPSVAVWRWRRAGAQHLQDVKQLFRHLEIRLIARVMKGTQDVV